MSHRFYFCTPGTTGRFTRQIVRPATRCAHLIAPGSTTTLLRRVMSRPDLAGKPGTRVALEPTRYLDTPDGRLAVYERGAGPILLFSHGWSGHAVQMASLMSAAEAMGFRAIAFDHYRHGASDGDDVNLPLMVRATQAIVDDIARDGGTIHGCVAHSIGAAALLHTSRLSRQRLFLIAPLIDLYPLLRERMLAVGLHPLVFDDLIDRVNAQYGLDHRAVDAAALLSGAGPCDVRVVHSTDDPVVPIDTSRALHRRAHVTELTEIAGRSHLKVLSHARTRERFVAWATGASAHSTTSPAPNASTLDAESAPPARPLSVAPLW